MMYGLRWSETDRNEQVVTKERDFTSEAARAEFIGKLEDKDNFIEVLAYADPQVEQEQEQEQETRTPAPKTSGIFKVTSTKTPEFGYIGASSQIEVAFRDYMNWVTKGKAPKAIQEEANRFDRNPDIFELTILEEMQGSRAELNKRKKEIAEGTPVEEPVAEEPQEEEELTVEERNNLILERLAEGKSVADVAEEFGVSKSTVYNVRNSQSQ